MQHIVCDIFRYKYINSSDCIGISNVFVYVDFN